MKRFLPLLLCIACFSCKKDGPSQRQSMQFTIDGLPDTVTIGQTDTTEIPMVVNYVSGNAERISLQISGLPTLVGAAFATSIDIPTFTSSLRLLSNHASAGIYDIAVTGSFADKTVTENFRLKVVPDPVNPAYALTGTYNETGPCTITGALNNTVTVAEDLPMFNKITLTRLWNNNFTTAVHADIDPQTHTITIPPQTINAATFSGSGTYTNNQINLSYSVATATGTDNCTVVLSK